MTNIRFRRCVKPSDSPSLKDYCKCLCCCLQLPDLTCLCACLRECVLICVCWVFAVACCWVFGGRWWSTSVRLIVGFFHPIGSELRGKEGVVKIVFCLICCVCVCERERVCVRLYDCVGGAEQDWAVCTWNNHNCPKDKILWKRPPKVNKLLVIAVIMLPWFTLSNHFPTMTGEMLREVKPKCDFHEIFTTSVPSSLADLCDLCLLNMWQLLRHVQDERGV